MKEIKVPKYGICPICMRRESEEEKAMKSPKDRRDHSFLQSML